MQKKSAIRLIEEKYLKIPHKPVPQGSLANLRPEKKSWNHSPTKAIRVPEQFADRLLEIAKEIDSKVYTEPQNSDFVQALIILENSLSMKANNGSAIKREIRESLGLLQNYI